MFSLVLEKLISHLLSALLKLLIMMFSLPCVVLGSRSGLWETQAVCPVELLVELFRDPYMMCQLYF